MKSLKAGLAVLLFVPAAAVAAVQDFSVLNRIVIHDNGAVYTEPRSDSTGFRMEIIGDADGYKGEKTKSGRPFIAAKNGESYSIRLYNPLPVRVAVNLTVDGLNSISGKPSGIVDGEKWLIEPYSYVLIRGWQVNGSEARRFFFTEKPKSYAKWRENVTGLKLSANCGVIAAAYFWSQADLDRYHADNYVYRNIRVSGYPLFSGAGSRMRGIGFGAAAGAAGSLAMNEPQEMDSFKRPESKLTAGTGMGTRESNPTQQVEFNFDAGMYSVSQALVVYYDFPTPEPTPNPFPTLAYSPEMP